MARPDRSAVRLHTAIALLTLLLCLGALAASAASFGWYACDPLSDQSSGYIDIPGVAGTQKHYFYWLFGPRRFPADGSQPPVILWMIGGPGWSSALALLSELGPCLMNETSGELYRNAYGWNDEAYLLFVDQPVGVGFSYGDKANYDGNQSEVAEDMYNFLQAFASQFISLSITDANDFYIIGESYGGHYVPSVGYRILQGNQRGDGPVINLRGIGIGNGLTDPYTQYPYYPIMAYEGCKAQLGHSCVNDSVHDEMLSMLPKCMELIEQCNAYPTDQNDACVAAHPYCREMLLLYRGTGLNVYDIRQPCDTPPLCYSFDKLIAFMRRAEVSTALGAHPDIVWNLTSSEVMAMFRRDYHRNFNWTIPPMLAAGIRVMVYAGDMDYIVNWLGIQAWVKALEWPGKAGFNAAADVEFSVGGRAAGQERQYGNFSFVRIYDAGHMPPMDQPATMLRVLSKFLHDAPLTASAFEEWVGMHYETAAGAGAFAYFVFENWQQALAAQEGMGWSDSYLDSLP